MSTAPPGPAAGAVDRSGGPHLDDATKRIALAVLAISQLMVVLDATIVNVALERIQVDLGISSDADLQWVVTGYALTFGGFLLLGGKLADRLGRRRVFMGGAVLFAVASLLGGLSTSPGLLIAARALQGLGGALMSPAALSLVTVVFAEGKERDRALGIWAAITAGGAALGLILGGVLTQYLSWQWVFFVNIPIAAVAVLGAMLFVPESRDTTAHGFDVPGAVLVTGGLMALVFGLVRGNELGWGSVQTVGTFVLAAALLAAFVVVQRRSSTPLVPYRLFKSSSVVGADVGALLIGAGVFGIFFFLTLWMQVINGYSPIRAGFAFLPMTLLIGVGAAVSANLLARTGPRPLLGIGTLIAGSGLLLLALRIEPDASYATVILPALALVAIGMGVSFVALTSAAVAGASDNDSGVASALLNSGQQVGGAVGLAILTAVSTSRTESLLPAGAETGRAAEGAPPPDPAVTAQLFEALTSGWAAGFAVAAGFLIAASVVTTSLVRVSKDAAARALQESTPG